MKHEGLAELRGLKCAQDIAPELRRRAVGRGKRSTRRRGESRSMPKATLDVGLKGRARALTSAKRAKIWAGQERPSGTISQACGEITPRLDAALPFPPPPRLKLRLQRWRSPPPRQSFRSSGRP